MTSSSFRDTKLKMTRLGRHKFYVIKFLELPYKDMNKYACIPWSWIRKRMPEERMLQVTYPVENPSDTEDRVKRREDFSEEWKLYNAVEKSSSNSYDDMQTFIKQIISDDHRKNKSSDINNGASNSEKQLNQEFAVSVNNDDISSTKLKIKRLAPSSPNKVAAKKRSYVIEPAESDDSKVAKESCQASELSPAHKRKKTNDCNCVKNTKTSEHNELSEKAFFTEFYGLLRNMHSSFASMHSMFSQFRSSFIDNTETIKEVLKSLTNNNFRATSSYIPTASTSKATTAEIKLSKRKRNEGTEEDGHVGDVLEKKHCYKPKSVLTPENDKIGSRSSLKYRKSGSGLVELIPETGVYVNAFKLGNCQKLAADCKTLALMLLQEIFKPSALSTCSFTSAREGCVEGTAAVPSTSQASLAPDVIPELDENAIIVLLTYVEEYGREKGWMFDIESIQNSIRDRMEDLRLYNL